MDRINPVQTARTGSKERASNGHRSYWQVEEKAQTEGEDKQIVRFGHEVDKRGRQQRSSSHPVAPPVVTRYSQARSPTPSPSPSPIRIRTHSQTRARRYSDDDDVDIHIIRRGAHDVLPRRHVDGIWDPGQSSDLTVHLNLDIKEDLDEEIEHFCYLHRIGSFLEARTFFDEHLVAHMDKPYVFVMFAEMLFRQGNYREICDLDARVITSLHEEVEKPLYVHILKGLWVLMFTTARKWCFQLTEPSWVETFPPVKKDLESFISDTANDSVGSLEVSLNCSLRLYHADRLIDCHRLFIPQDRTRHTTASSHSPWLLSTNAC